MVLYFLAAAQDDKLKYIGTIQMFFFLTGIGSVISRIANGMVTLDLLPLVAASILGMTVGEKLGSRIVEKINITQLKKLIYAFLALAGVITFVKALV